MSETQLALCSCRAEYQDRTYGRGIRVFNVATVKDLMHCTVCRREVSHARASTERLA